MSLFKDLGDSSFVASTYASEALGKYDPLVIQRIIFSIVVIALILIGIVIYYFISIRKLKPDEPPKGFALIIFTMIIYFKNLVLELLGPRFVKATPYFLVLFSYILLSNFAGLIGLENPTSSATVTLSMGLVTFIGTFVVGIRFQRWSFLNQFTIRVKIKNKKIPVFLNPLEIVGKITPLVSISMRLWGNIFAGTLITTLWFVIPVGAAQIPADQVVGGGHPLMLIMSALTPPLTIYLDILTGSVQAFVFVLLTMVYWKMEASHNEQDETHFENNNLVKLNRIEKI